MSRLILINGAPGSGKSTVAHAVAQDSSMTLALEIDTIKHSLGRWDEDPQVSGLHASGTFRAIDFEGSLAGAEDRPIPGMTCRFARVGASLRRADGV